MAVAIALVAVGVVLLAYASDAFVLGAARLAAALDVDAVVVGALVIGFGTGMPELLVSGLAAGRGSLDAAIGNVVGSNLANLTLVLGTAALVTPALVSHRILRREAPISVAAVALLALLAQNGLERAEAAVLLLALAIATAATLVAVRPRVPDVVDVATADEDAEERSDQAAFAGEVTDFIEEEGAASWSVRREVVRLLSGLTGTVAAAYLLVTGALEIADRAGLSEGIVGLTIVGMGTSLPELVTAVQGARRGEADLVVGNVLGSNVFNALAVGGAAGLIGPGPLPGAVTGVPTVAMVVVSLVAWGFLRLGYEVRRWEGGVLLATYAAVLTVTAL
jgi:cation:H+ antiporter